VLTPDGLRAVEDIEVGDTVLSYDPQSGRLVANEVEQTYVKLGVSWISARFADGSVLDATADHECYDATSVAYEPIQSVARFLRVGDDASATASGTTACERAYGAATFYDLRLKDYPHNYVVNGVVVHNKGGGGAVGVDTSEIAGTYTFVSGSSTNSNGDTVTFSSGTLTIGTNGAWNLTSSGNTTAPGAANPVSTTASNVFTSGSGRGPFSGTYTATDTDSGTYSEPSTGTFTNVVVDATGLLTGSYSGTTTGSITFTGTISYQGPAQPDFGTLLQVNSTSPHPSGGTVMYYFEVSQPSGPTNHNIRVGIYLSDDATITTADTLVNSHNVTTNAGSIVTQNSTFTLPMSATGTKFVGVIVDDQDAVSEVDETNNTANVMITIN
jgi:hypothetical protein